MAKEQVQVEANDIKDFLAAVEQPSAVYDAKQVTNRAMVVTKVDYKIYEPTEKNNYQVGEKTIMQVTFIGSGEKAVVETSMTGITVPIAALVAANYLPFRCMIIPKGKFLALAPA